MKQSELRAIRDLFKALYFIHESSGVLLFTKSFDTEMPDPDLVSGLITAINSFAHSISKTASKESIRSINMEEMRIIYFRISALLCVAISRNINQNEEHAMLNYLGREFYGTFKLYIENFAGNIRNFETFEQKLIAFENFISNNRLRELSNKILALKTTELTPLPPKHQLFNKTEVLENNFNLSID